MILSRRAVLLGAALGVGGCPRAAYPAERTAAEPLSIYYSDDTTGIVSNASPFHKRGEDVSEREIAASIDEAADAGIDVYVNQPGTGWIPWWRSDVYPADAHYRWYAETYGVKLSGFEKFIAAGGDVVGTALEHCRARNLTMMVSIRLNDIHGIALSGRSPDDARAHLTDPEIAEWQRRLPITMSRIHMDHPDWRIVPGSTKTSDMLWNWGVPEAVAHKLALCAEVVERYDVDGIELDFMRYPRFFPDEVPLTERKAIIRRFVGGVRAALDKGRKGRELALRVPAKIGGLAPLGLDPTWMAEVGVNRLTLSSNSFTSQDVDIDAYHSAVSGLHLSLECAQAKHFLMHQSARSPGDNGLLLARPADDITTAYLAQRGGCDSLSLFNFVYYRHLTREIPDRDDRHEPPFEVIRRLKRPDTIAQPVQSWFLATVYFNGIPGAQMPGHLGPTRPLRLKMTMFSPASGWAETGTLRLVARKPPAQNATGDFVVRLNGVTLVQTEPFVAGWDEDPGLPFRGWRLPRAALRDGANEVEIRTSHGDGAIEIPLLEILIAGA